MERSTVKTAAESVPGSFRSTMSRRRPILFIALIFLLAGCIAPAPGTAVPRTLPCPSLADSPWGDFTLGVDNPSDVVSAVVKGWGIEKDQIEDTSSAQDPRPILRWRTTLPGGDFDLFHASFDKEKRLKRLGVAWTWPYPTFAQIIDCLGYPDHYIAFKTYWEAISLNVVFFYTGIGLVVHHDGYSWGEGQLEIEHDMRLNGFILVAPGTAEQMASDIYRYRTGIYLYRSGPEHLSDSVCLLKPWPGSIEAMEIATVEEMERCGV